MVAAATVSPGVSKTTIAVEKAQPNFLVTLLQLWLNLKWIMLPLIVSELLTLCYEIYKLSFLIDIFCLLAKNRSIYHFFEHKRIIKSISIMADTYIHISKTRKKFMVKNFEHTFAM